MQHLDLEVKSKSEVSNIFELSFFICFIDIMKFLRSSKYKEVLLVLYCMGITYLGETNLQRFAASNPFKVKCPPIGISKISIFFNFSKTDEQGR